MPQRASSKQRFRTFLRNPAPVQEASTGEDGRASPRPAGRGYAAEYRRWLWPYRFALLGVLALAVVAAGLDLIWPLAIKWMIDGVRPGLGPADKLRWLHWLGGGVLVVLVVKQVLETRRSMRVAALNAKIIFRLRRRLFEKFLRLPLATLSAMKAGGIVSRLSGDVDAVSGLVQQAIIAPGVAVLRVGFTLAILFVLSWQLAVGALIALPPMAALSYLWIKRVKPLYRSAQQDRVDVDGRVNETFGGIRIVRAFRREGREVRTYATTHHTIIRKSLRAQQWEMTIEAAWGLLVPAASLLVVWLGGYLVLKGRAEVGDLFAFQIYAILLMQPVWQIVSSLSQTQKSIAAMERVFEVLDLPADKPDAADAIDAPAEVREIEFRHVGFTYGSDSGSGSGSGSSSGFGSGSGSGSGFGSAAPALADIHFRVPGGSVVALVGPSGAGKTTLTDLVARFHDPTAGGVFLNGVDLRRFKLQSFRRLLAVVAQDVFLFDGTVAENIAYGRRHATDLQILDAARRANAHEFIARLPDGYDTPVGERGLKLSGGQRQRLSIARAILADPQILILDEATSNLDTESEQLIQASLAELFKGRTTFVIAHRLSTVTGADLIVALDDGAVREMGTHDELLRRQGFYYEMVERQCQSLDRVAGGAV